MLVLLHASGSFFFIIAANAEKTAGTNTIESRYLLLHKKCFMEVKIFNPPKLMCRIRDITEDGYLPIQKVKLSVFSDVSGDGNNRANTDT